MIPEREPEKRLPHLRKGNERANYPILTQGGSDKKYQYEALLSCNWNEHNSKAVRVSIGGQVWCQQPR